MIEVHEQFEVPAAPDVVFGLLADPMAVVGCVPGAAIVGTADDGTLDTTLGIKFGPVGVQFRATAQLELDAAARSGHLSARGKDRQGGARFTAHATFAVRPGEGEAADTSVVETAGTVEISGRLASMIESGAGVVAKRMSSEFASCLRARVVALQV